MIEFTYGAKDENKTKSRCDRAEIVSGFIYLYDKQGVNYGAISLENDVIVIKQLTNFEQETKRLDERNRMRKPVFLKLGVEQLEDKDKDVDKDVEIAELKGELKACKETIDKLIKSVL